jgi:NAD(P) transhydrogenase subunit beta
LNVHPALIAVAMAHRRGDRPVAAKTVEMTGMPELIALLHSFVGLAAVLVGWNSYLETHPTASPRRPGPAMRLLLDIHNAEVFIGVFIGAVTFTGSIVAYLKLSAR